jgi:hypothetical protein
VDMVKQNLRKKRQLKLKRSQRKHQDIENSS